MTEIEDNLRRSYDRIAWSDSTGHAIAERAISLAAGAASDASGVPRRASRIKIALTSGAVGAVAAVAILVPLAIAQRHDSNPLQPAGSAIPLSTNDWRPGDDAMQMLVTGKISVTSTGCVYLGTSPSDGVDILWPAGWSARETQDSGVEIYDADGALAARSGDVMRTSGGETYATSLVCRATDNGAVSVNGAVQVVR